MRRVLLLVVLGMGLVVFGLGRVAGQTVQTYLNHRCKTQMACTALGAAAQGQLADGSWVLCNFTTSGTVYFTCASEPLYNCQEIPGTTCVGFVPTEVNTPCYRMRWSCD